MYTCLLVTRGNLKTMTVLVYLTKLSAIFNVLLDPHYSEMEVCCTVFSHQHFYNILAKRPRAQITSFPMNCEIKLIENKNLSTPGFHLKLECFVIYCINRFTFNRHNQESVLVRHSIQNYTQNQLKNKHLKFLILPGHLVVLNTNRSNIPNNNNINSSDQNFFFFFKSIFENKKRNKRSHASSQVTKDHRATLVTQTKDDNPQNLSSRINRHTCPLGFYGNNCSDMCNCVLSSTCHIVTGKCPGERCSVAWRGQNCNQSICPVGLYGIKSNNLCIEKCKCGLDQNCDAITGQCERNQCSNGSFCLLQSCKRRFFPPGSCNKVCGCWGDSVCNPVTGECKPGNCKNPRFHQPQCMNLVETQSDWITLIAIAFFLIMIVLKTGYFIVIKTNRKMYAFITTSDVEDDVRSQTLV